MKTAVHTALLRYKASPMLLYVAMNKKHRFAILRQSLSSEEIASPKK